MGRGEEKIEQLISATIELLLVEGAGGLSMRKVADKCGISLSNLQYYYNDKESLIEATIHRYFTAYEIEVRGEIALMAGKPPMEIIEALLNKHLVCDLSNRQCVMFREIYSLATRNAAVQKLVSSYYIRYVQRLTEMFSASVPNAQQIVGFLLPYIEGYSLMGSALVQTRENIIKNLLQVVNIMVDTNER